mmetsp:Transcript_40961/g.112597  ORF Transcript_40961/g.112597 Transcript_40961/m.112597 type:complete len:218 (+) Transcript_40961:1106-1759(+)
MSGRAIRSRRQLCPPAVLRVAWRHDHEPRQQRHGGVVDRHSRRRLLGLSGSLPRVVEEDPSAHGESRMGTQPFACDPDARDLAEAWLGEEGRAEFPGDGELGEDQDAPGLCRGRNVHAHALLGYRRHLRSCRPEYFAVHGRGVHGQGCVIVARRRRLERAERQRPDETEWRCLVCPKHSIREEVTFEFPPRASRPDRDEVGWMRQQRAALHAQLLGK